MVQQKFQGVLDQYVQRAIADEARAEQVLREGTEWDQRWQGTLDGCVRVLLLLLLLLRAHVGGGCLGLPPCSTLRRAGGNPTNPRCL
jgi:hypothetical protein